MASSSAKSVKSETKSLIASQEEPEKKAILLVYIQTDTLNRYDLIHNLTVNNSTSIVRAETREGLIAAVAKYTRTEQDNKDKTGLAYYVYRHDEVDTQKVCIVPIPEKFLKEQTTDKIYTKQELLGYTHKEAWIGSLPTIQENWPHFHKAIKKYIEKYASAEYDEITKQNVIKYNEKIANRDDSSEETIEFSERKDSICFGRAPFKCGVLNTALTISDNSSEESENDEPPDGASNDEYLEETELIFGSYPRPGTPAYRRRALTAPKLNVPNTEDWRTPGRLRNPQKQSTENKKQMKTFNKSLDRSPGREQHLRSLGHNISRTEGKRAYEFQKVIEYTMYDHKHPDATPEEFFENLIQEIETNLKRGDIFDVRIDGLIHIMKSVISQKEKRRVLVRNAQDVRSLPELKEAFCKTVAIPKSLRKAQFARIQQKPKHISWPDFATNFEKQFELSYDQSAEGGKNSVLFDRFIRCLNTPRQKNTMEHFLLMVDESQHSIHLLAEKLELMESMEFGQKEVDRQELNRLQAKHNNKVTCTYCQITGHTRQECRRRQRIEGQNNNNNKKQTRRNQGNYNNNRNRIPQKCGRCNRQGHSTADCFANLNRDNKYGNQNNRRYDEQKERHPNNERSSNQNRRNQRSNKQNNRSIRTLDRPKATNFRMNSFPGQ